MPTEIIFRNPPRRVREGPEGSRPTPARSGPDGTSGSRRRTPDRWVKVLKVDQLFFFHNPPQMHIAKTVSLCAQHNAQEMELLYIDIVLMRTRSFT